MSHDCKDVHLHCPTLCPSQVCWIKCTDTFPWGILFCVCIVVPSRYKPTRLHDLAGHLVAKECSTAWKSDLCKYMTVLLLFWPGSNPRIINPGSSETSVCTLLASDTNHCLKPEFRDSTYKSIWLRKCPCPQMLCVHWKKIQPSGRCLTVIWKVTGTVIWTERQRNTSCLAG